MSLYIKLTIFSGESDSDSGSSSSDNGSDTDEASGPTHSFADLSRGDPAELLSQLREMGNMDYSLIWIQRCLNRTAEDREDGMLDMMLTPIISIKLHCLHTCMVFVCPSFHAEFISNSGLYETESPLNRYETSSMGVSLHDKLLVMLLIYEVLYETALLPMLVLSKLVTSTCCYPHQ